MNENEALNKMIRLQKNAERLMEFPSRFVTPKSIDNWRHTRMLALANPLLKASPFDVWMTVGDGRYGSDSAYLLAFGMTAIASSLTDDTLKIAYEKGWITEYRVENAECLSLKNDSVDWILCKESYHHFPRPPVAFYEMLRVAAKGIFLIEPIDERRVLNIFKSLIKKLLRGRGDIDFEPSGNYLYRVSIKEIIKMHLGLGGRLLAFKKLNDFYHEKLSNMPADSRNLFFIMTKLGISLQNGLCRLGLLGFGLGGIIVFKKEPEESLIQGLREEGYEILYLPKNPYF